jgi:hypothetical protein
VDLGEGDYKHGSSKVAVEEFVGSMEAGGRKDCQFSGSRSALYFLWLDSGSVRACGEVGK